MARFHRRGAQLVQFTAEEEIEWDARAVAGGEAQVNRYRKAAKRAVRDEADERTITLLGSDNDSLTELIIEQVRDLSKYTRLVRREAAGTITAPQLTSLNALQTMYKDDMAAIRTAKRDALDALDLAGVDTQLTIPQRLAEIDAVVPAWP